MLVCLGNCDETDQATAVGPVAVGNVAVGHVAVGNAVDYHVAVGTDADGHVAVEKAVAVGNAVDGKAVAVGQDGN